MFNSATTDASSFVAENCLGSAILAPKLFSFPSLACAILILILHSVLAQDGFVLLLREGSKTSIQILSDDNYDWRLQSSTDLLSWTNATPFGILLSGDTNAPLRTIDSTSDGPLFYRTLKTEGLYDTSLFRTINLTFVQSNWATLLDRGRTTGSNTPCLLLSDNGANISGVGARYKGNTSYTSASAKKSINLEINFTNSQARLLGYKTVNLNNASGDETIMREPLYFNIMSQYVPCPRGSMAKLYINGAYWGVYSLIQQENNELIQEWFSSDSGDRWKAPNIATSGGFSGGSSAFSYLGAGISLYTRNYELKTDNSTNAWQRLVNAITILNRTPAPEFRDKVEEVFAVDRWLWYLALENVLADDDSYWHKGADYGFYYEPESGRIHPVQHDGNEAFTASDVSLSPVYGATLSTRPLLFKFLPIPELRQRYLAHLRTVLQDHFNPQALTPIINAYHKLTVADIIRDPKKNYTMAAYTNDLNSLKTWVTNRFKFLTYHAELRPLPPNILQVSEPSPLPGPADIPFITAHVEPNGTNGVDSVWLYWRDKTYGKFDSSQMFDDGNHNDGAPGDNIFGGTTTNFPAGRKIHFYIEARSANPAKAASFSPARAEQVTYNYEVQFPSSPSTPVVINEIMAANASTVADPQGDFDDWIELRNITGYDVDLSGLHLSDESNNPRKWKFPPGAIIPAYGYLIVWADEDTTHTPGLHASFKLSASGEVLYLTDTDENLNAVLDSLQFPAQSTDLSYGRDSANPGEFTFLSPTPNAPNN